MYTLTLEAQYREEGSLRIPLEPCTHDAFFRHLPHLGVRDLLCWAYRTETTVRLAKVEGRGGRPSSSSSDGAGVESGGGDEDGSYSKTLRSDFLVDIYPESDGKRSKAGDLSKWGREEYKFSRKAHPGLISLVEETDDFNGLTPIAVEEPNKRKRAHGGSRDESVDGPDNLKGGHVVPPTLLHFEMLLEAYMGYSLNSDESYYHHPDPSYPRAAVMGGAVVAALTAYRDEVIVRMFETSGLFTESGQLQGPHHDKLYWESKASILDSLHGYFTHTRSQGFMYDYPRNSKFADGDVDIFLQASPLSQGIVQALCDYGVGEQCGLIGSFVGNAGICDQDLERFATKVVEDAVEVELPDDDSYRDGWSFAFSVSKNAASFILGNDDAQYRPDEGHACYDARYWPRTTQFILLDSRADLLGGLLDFDLSVVACSYDGASVRVAPRAAVSLMTKGNFITPFCFEEHRNKKRVKKYAGRGFHPFLVDPHDDRPQQKVACDARILSRPFHANALPRDPIGQYNADQDPSDRDEILRIQDEKNESEDCKFCCHCMDYDEPLGKDARGTYRYLGIMYTQKLFEVSPGDAVDFFSKRFEWTEDDFRKVNEVDPYLRMACRRCKNEYLLCRVVMAKYPALMKEYNLEDDNLRSEFSYMHTNGHFQPSFYSGSVFDSTRIRGDARRTIENMSMMRAQSIFEVSSWVLKHGSPKDYSKRFVFDRDLEETFRKAHMTSLREPARPPIGLNPERFVDRCDICTNWLTGNRYGSKACQNCDRKKPAAS